MTRRVLQCHQINLREIRQGNPCQSVNPHSSPCQHSICDSYGLGTMFRKFSKKRKTVRFIVEIPSKSAIFTCNQSSLSCRYRLLSRKMTGIQMLSASFRNAEAVHAHLLQQVSREQLQGFQISWQRRQRRRKLKKRQRHRKKRRRRNFGWKTSCSTAEISFVDVPR